MFNPEDLAYREPEPKKKKGFPRPNKWAFLVPIFLLFGIAIGVGGIYVYQNYIIEQEEPPEVPLAELNAPPQDVLELIEDVEVDYPEIPKNEIPSVATISDIKSLSDQAFFDGAQEGDRLMIYAAAHMAILYRPSTNEIVRRGPLEIVNEEGETSENASSESAVLSASDSAIPALRIKY